MRPFNGQDYGLLGFWVGVQDIEDLGSQFDPFSIEDEADLRRIGGQLTLELRPEPDLLTRYLEEDSYSTEVLGLFN